MHKVSDGQRRRVQICMGLLYPYKVNFFTTNNLQVIVHAIDWYHQAYSYMAYVVISELVEDFLLNMI